MERNCTKIQWSKFLYKILMRVLHLSTGGIPEGLFYKWRNISPSFCCCLSLVPCNDCVRTETESSENSSACDWVVDTACFRVSCMFPTKWRSLSATSRTRTTRASPRRRRPNGRKRPRKSSACWPIPGQSPCLSKFRVRQRVCVKLYFSNCLHPRILLLTMEAGEF